MWAENTDEIYEPSEGNQLSINMNRIGERVGPFQLESLISDGEGVSLYRAIRPEGSREPRVVAVRVADNPSDTNAAAVIRNEYEVLRHLNDNRIPRTHGFYASQPALSLSHFEGVSLSEIIRLWQDEALTINVATAIDILMEIAQALRSAHATKREGIPIVHGHLGANKILLAPNGRVIVQGFGASPRGTFAAYTPPEQAAAAFLDARSDQWTLGAIGVELLLGERLYTGVTDRREAAINGAVEPWITMLEQRFPSASRVLGRMLSPAAGDRYESDGEVIADLLALARQCAAPADRPKLASNAWSLVHVELESKPTQPDAALANEPIQPPHSADPVEAPTVAADPEPDVASTQAPTEIASSPIAAVSAAPPVPASASIVANPEPASSAAVATPATVSVAPSPTSAVPAPVEPKPMSPETAPTGPRLVVPTQPSLVRPEPAMVPTPHSNEETEPTEQIQVPPPIEPSPEPPQSVPVEGKRIEDAIEEVKRSEMAAFIMVGVLVLVAIIFLAIRYD